MHFLAIVSVSISAAVLYGILHDQITARICVEYFTIGHPRVIQSEDPTMLGFVWGVIATWWVGLLLGVPLAVAARYGATPPRRASELIPSIAAMMSATAIGAVLAGLIGWSLASAGLVILIGPIANQVPADRHVAFIIDLWAHSASYLLGAIFGLILIIRVWFWREEEMPEESDVP